MNNINISMNGNGLYLLIAVLGLFIIYFLIRNSRNSKKTASHKPEPQTASVEAVQINENAQEANPMNDYELMAVISAAIASCMGSSSNIVVRNIVRVGDNAPAWAKVGKSEQMGSRL